MDIVPIYKRVIGLDVLPKRKHVGHRHLLEESVCGIGVGKAAINFVNASATSQLGLDCLARGGKLVLVGVAGGELVLSLAGMILKPKTIQGSATGNPQDLRDVVTLANAGELKSIPLTLLPKAPADADLTMLHDGQVRGRIVLVAA